MNNELYVNYSGLDDNIEELKHWKVEFNAVNEEFNRVLNEMNRNWQGTDYDQMKAKVSSELARITGNEGQIQRFIEECTQDLENKKGNYVSIQNKNTNSWE